MKPLARAPKSSYLWVDRSTAPDTLVMGEYCKGTKKHPCTRCVSDYRLNPGPEGQARAVPIRVSD